MTPSTAIKNFPAHKFDAARAALGKLQARLVRAATRLGQPAPLAPVLTITREFEVSRCTACGTQSEGFIGGSCMVCKEGHFVTRQFLDLALVVAPPVVAGWEFIAVIEPLEGGNLIRTVPGANVDESFDFSAWRKGAIKCDHCNTVRRRTETFLVRADGTLEGYPAGETHQVGRNCLADFLGGKTAESILASLSFESTVRACGDEDGEGGWGGSGECVYNPATVLTQTAACVRLDGWTSRKTAGEQEGARATASQVLELFTPPFGDRTRWYKEVERCAPTTGDITKGAAALAWAAGLTGTSDYERNLALLAVQSVVKASHFGILCSAISGYERFLGTQTKKVAAGVSSFVGTVGEKIIVTVEVVGVFDVETQYGTLHINKFRDEAGNCIVWKTTSVRFDVAKTVTLKGTVKKQEEFRGEKQTELTRCSEVEPGTVLKAAKVSKPRAKKAAPSTEPVARHYEECLANLGADAMETKEALLALLEYRGAACEAAKLREELLDYADKYPSPIRPHGIKEEIGY